MPELKYFQDTGAYEHPERDLVCQFFLGPKEETDEDPKDLIQKAGSVIVEPPLSWA
jgi:hypothetical protein